VERRIILVVADADATSSSIEDDVAIERVATAAEAIERLVRGDPADAVLAPAGAGALEILRACRERDRETPVLVLAASVSVAEASEAIREGAFDYLSATVGAEPLRAAIRRALRQRSLADENRSLRRSLAEKHRLGGIVGQSEAMLQVFKTAARVATTDAPVLLLGEPGTGRELVARSIHDASARAACPFVPVDCAALPEAVLETELLGHAGGPGGRASQRGLLETAQGGTLYLESIGRAGWAVQAALVRAVEDGVLRRPGTPDLAPVRIRVVASADGALLRGRLRDDLLYRLGAVTIAIPPLRERREDIPLLAEHFAAKAARGGRGEISPPAMTALHAYPWPGNVRELECAIARALALSSSSVVLVENLPPAVSEALRVPQTSPGATLRASGTRPTLADMERRYAAEILRETGGNKTRAADILGIDRKTLYRLIGENGDETVMTPLPGGATPVPRRSR
jgi:two-component system response regulator AtoC